MLQYDQHVPHIPTHHNTSSRTNPLDAAMRQGNTATTRIFDRGHIAYTYANQSTDWWVHHKKQCTSIGKAKTISLLIQHGFGLRGVQP